MFKLAHISDVHLGPLPDLTLRQLMSKRITGYVNWHRNRRKHLFGDTLELLIDDIATHEPDHLAITGDLVNLATDIEIEAASRWLSTLPDPATVSVVPGNHDAYVPGAIEKTCRKWAPWMRGDGFESATLTPSQTFPYVRIRDRVALIGVSTASATPPFMASGFFSDRQARELANHLKDLEARGFFRVVMIHHPPIRGAIASYKRMIGIRRFAAVLHMAGAELVLHGHTHLNTLYWLNGKQRRVPVVGISSASQGPGGNKPNAAYNLFEIDGEPGAWSLLRKRYSLGDDGKTIALAHQDALISPASA
ncbi:MAG: hypothetical protein RLZZ444_1136 [Pseudomonadota bacterium]|jgi:3',5'-cyclic AMP phosphodiesterase CpdA